MPSDEYMREHYYQPAAEAMLNPNIPESPLMTLMDAHWRELIRQIRAVSAAAAPVEPESPDR